MVNSWEENYAVKKCIQMLRLGMRGKNGVTLSNGSWQQYDVILNARGYGWDMMKDRTDYLSEADLEDISQVTTGIMDEASSSVTQSYIDHGRKCAQTPELDTEQGILSIAGMSKVLQVPVKIVWINQTNQLRLFTSVADESTMKKYVETVVRRTFGTKDAMKIGIPVPICLMRIKFMPEVKCFWYFFLVYVILEISNERKKGER